MMTVSDLMSKKLVTLQASDSLYEARQLMEVARIRHLPIVDGKKRLVGLVTLRDILTYTVSSLAGIDEKTRDEIDAGIPISEMMRSELTTAKPDHKLRDAAELLLRQKFGCLPVVDNGVLVGIITEADFLRLTIQLLDGMDEE